jgi:hypothetical protein
MIDTNHVAALSAVHFSAKFERGIPLPLIRQVGLRGQQAKGKLTALRAVQDVTRLACRASRLRERWVGTARESLQS